MENTLTTEVIVRLGGGVGIGATNINGRGTIGGGVDDQILEIRGHANGLETGTKR